MANRQYVGARYVPKFADPVEWNSALSYEALTIVTHLGNSFTSKKPVPAGVDIGNTEYWVNTGNYNEQVANVVNQIAEVTKYTCFVNVKECGAKGDGVTDDTAAINSALNLAKNGYLYFPLGVYLVNKTVSGNNILMDTGTEIKTLDGATHPMVVPSANNFNKVIGASEKIYAKNNCAPREALIGTNTDWLPADTSLTTTSGEIASNTNVIVVNNSAGIAVGDAVICGAAGFPNGNTITNSVRVISITGNNITVGLDNGEGSGVGDATWRWSGDTYAGTFMFRKRLWRCDQEIGIETGADNNPDRIDWCSNLVAVSNGQQVYGQEIDVISQGNNNGQTCHGLLVTGQNNNGATLVGVDVQMGGAQPGNYGISSRGYIIGVNTAGATGLIFEPKWHNNSTNADETIFGGVVQSDFGDYVSLRPSVAVKQIANGAVCIALKPSQDNAAGWLIRATNVNGDEERFGVDTTGIVHTPCVRISKMPEAKTISATHVFEVQAADGSVWEIPVAQKS